MAVNSASDYGTDIACISDADELFTEATGIAVVVQDVFHLLLSDDFLGPDGDGLGFDCRRLVGLSVDELAGMEPILSQVVERDDRVLRANVTLTVTTRNGLADVAISISAETTLGPFTATKSVLELTTDDLEGDGTQ